VVLRVDPFPWLASTDAETMKWQPARLGPLQLCGYSTEQVRPLVPSLRDKLNGSMSRPPRVIQDNCIFKGKLL